MTIADITERMILPSGYGFGPDRVKARIVGRKQIVDYLIAFDPSTRTDDVPPDRILRAGDLLICLGTVVDERTGIGIFHPGSELDEPIAPAGASVALRPINLNAGVSIFATLLPYFRLHQSANFVYRDIRKREVVLLSEDRVRVFLDTIFNTAKLKATHRRSGELMEELIPSMAQKLVKEAKASDLASATDAS